MSLAGVTSTVSTLAIAGQTMMLEFLAVLAAQDEHRQDIGRVLKLTLQHLCVSVPDRAEYRLQAAEAVVRLLALMPSAERLAAMAWLLKFAHNSKSGCRCMALDIAAGALLVRDRKQKGKK